MLVLAAPASDNPHGDVYTIPGELVMPSPIVCDAGREDACPCVRTWVGITSKRTTEIAEVRDQALTRDEYLDLFVACLAEPPSCWEDGYAREQSADLADLAADYTPGTLVRIGLSEDREYHEFSAMEP